MRSSKKKSFTSPKSRHNIEDCGRYNKRNPLRWRPVFYLKIRWQLRGGIWYIYIYICLRAYYFCNYELVLQEKNKNKKQWDYIYLSHITLSLSPFKNYLKIVILIYVRNYLVRWNREVLGRETKGENSVHELEAKLRWFSTQLMVDTFTKRVIIQYFLQSTTNVYFLFHMNDGSY